MDLDSDVLFGVLVNVNGLVSEVRKGNDERTSIAQTDGKVGIVGRCMELLFFRDRRCLSFALLSGSQSRTEGKKI